MKRIAYKLTVYTLFYNVSFQQSLKMLSIIFEYKAIFNPNKPENH